MSQPLDYKELLKKYMRLVQDKEGWSFLADASIGADQWDFSQEEFDYLEKLANEVLS